MKKLSLKKCMKWLLAAIVVLIGIGFTMDTEPPTMNGINQTVEYSTKLKFSEIVEVTDNRSEEILVETVSANINGITIDNEEQNIIFDDTGKYAIEFSAIDESENQNFATVEIEVVDTQKPRILSSNDNVSIGYNEVADVGSEEEFLELQIEEKSEYSVSIVNIENAEADDSTDLYELSKAQSKIKFLQMGTYSLEFTIEDSFGNIVTDTATVEVVDKTSPVIECEEKYFSLSDSDKKGNYIAKLVASDEIDGDLTKSIEIDDSEVKYGTIGEYQIHATVVDKSENVCTESFAVIIEDKTAPQLSLSRSTFSLNVNSGTPDYRSIATAVDGVDGNITELIEIDDSNVDYDSAGIYKVVYKITDSSGNTATKKATIKIKEVSSSSSSAGAEVMITRTGECYHTHKCGNGNYFWVSMAEALSRGLRACQKCY